ncbi:MAG: hypothetical protein Q8R76_01555 [Candidatus Omnitrophota bacterium]|nr:hypothetical protein [Candidatus Omnitrophota bacterium]
MTPKALVMIISLAFMMSVGGASPVYAVDINSDFEGTLVITTPDGEIILVQPGESIPEIAPGSVLEVFDGQFAVATAAGDSVVVLHLDHEVTVADGASLEFIGTEDQGNVRVVNGPVTVLTNVGEEIILNTGDEYIIQSQSFLPGLPATAEGRSTGFSPDDDSIPDSSDIDDDQDNNDQGENQDENEDS